MPGKFYGFWRERGAASMLSPPLDGFIPETGEELGLSFHAEGNCEMVLGYANAVPGRQVTG
jgi:hypothetical protein